LIISIFVLIINNVGILIKRSINISQVNWINKPWISMKIIINFYLLILALAILIFDISQLNLINTKRFATNLFGLCIFGINFNHYKFLKHFDNKKLNCYVFTIWWLFLSRLFINFDQITLFRLKFNLMTSNNILSYCSLDYTFYHN
jgi:anaerobic C4-dicarboxylate transporter